MDKTCTRCETPKPLDQYDRNRATKDGLCHYTNLQPLWADENMSKGASIA